MEKQFQIDVLWNKTKSFLENSDIQLNDEKLTEIEKLIESLNIAHIELKMQNQELQQANTKLLTERLKYEEMYFNAPIAYITLNKTGNIYQINKAAAAMFGLEMHRFKFTSIYPYLTESSKLSFNKFFTKVFSCDTSEHSELSFINSEGQVIHSKLQAISYLDVEIEERLCRLALTDISLEKNKLESKVQNFQTLFDGVVDPIYIHNLAGKFLLVNQKACNRLGYTSEEFDTLSVSNVDALYNPIALKKNVDILKEKGVVLFEGVHKTKSGETFPVEIHSQLIEFDGDKAVMSIARDISRRKRQESDLLKFKTIVNQSPLSIVITSQKGAIEYVNPQFTNLTGFTFDEAKGKNPKVLKSGLVPDSVFANLWQTIFRKEIWKGELINKRKNGELFWESAIIGPILDSQGNIDSFIALKEDITKRKEIQEALITSELRFRKLFNSINDAVYIYPQKQEGLAHFVEVNKVACSRFGYTREELLQKTACDLFHFNLSDSKQDSLPIKELLAKKTAFEAFQICKNGISIPVEISKSEVEISKQKLIMMIVRDIHERKEAEQQLRILNTDLKMSVEELNSTNEQLAEVIESLNISNSTLEQERNQFVNLLDTIPENIYVSDKETFEIIFANKKLKESYNKDIVGKKCYEELNDKDVPCDFCTNNIIFEKNEPYFWEKHNETLQKDLYMIDRAIKWIDGRNARFQLAIDISKLKKAEKELKELNATKDKFFSIISHDLRSPFNSIIGFSDLLVRNLDTMDSTKIRRFVENIRNSSQNSYKLLENLLEWSRSQTGKIEFLPAQFQLIEVVKEVIETVEMQAKNKEINLYYFVDEYQMVYADSNMLNTILRNLISNAIKFTPRKGSVTITALKYNQNIEISVIDTGIGIDEHTKRNLFKINEKTTSHGTENEHGTGLGLLLCYEFANKHSSQIMVESEVGKGSTFSIMLKESNHEV